MLKIELCMLLVFNFIGVADVVHADASADLVNVNKRRVNIRE